MRFDPGKSLLQWWRNATPRSRWMAGIVLFSLLCTGALLILSGQPVGDPSSAAPDLSGLDYASAFFKLLCVLAIIVGGGVLLRRFANRSTVQGKLRQLEVVETVRLSPKQSMHIVRAGDKTLLVGATDQSLALISEINLVAAPEAQTAPAPKSELSFQAIISSLNSGGR